MCKLRGIIWYIIHANQMLLKIWPHLTFGWPFVNISLTIHPTHSKTIYFCDPYDRTSNLIYMKGHSKHFEILTPTWPLRDPCWEGGKSSKILSKYFLTYNDFKLLITHFHQNGTWVLLPLQSSIVITIHRQKSMTMNMILLFINIKGFVNPRLTKLFFVTRLTKWGILTTPSLDFPNRTPFEIDFGINR